MDRLEAAMNIVASPNAEPSEALLARWASFILWLSVLGIVFLTFFPFQAFPVETAVRRVPPFFEWFLGKPSDPPTDFLNVRLRTGGPGPPKGLEGRMAVVGYGGGEFRILAAD
jgi:hypothetical protein